MASNWANISIQWRAKTPAIHLQDILKNETFPEHVVYVWSELPPVDRVSYVGRATSYTIRQNRHLGQTRNGKCIIPSDYRDSSSHFFPGKDSKPMAGEIEAYLANCTVSYGVIAVVKHTLENQPINELGDDARTLLSAIESQLIYELAPYTNEEKHKSKPSSAPITIVHYNAFTTWLTPEIFRQIEGRLVGSIIHD